MLSNLLNCCSIKEFTGMNTTTWKPKDIDVALVQYYKQYEGKAPGHVIFSIATTEGEEGDAIRYDSGECYRRMDALKKHCEESGLGVLTVLSRSRNNRYGPRRQVQVAILQVNLKRVKKLVKNAGLKRVIDQIFEPPDALDDEF